MIARRVREHNVFSEILPPETTIDDIKKRHPSALIFSGGPCSVFTVEAPLFDNAVMYFEIRFVGFCYGLQLLAHHHGGSVESTGHGEYGFTEIEVDDNKGLFKNVSHCSQVWMSHMDRVSELPNGWHMLAHSSNGVVAAMANHDLSLIHI